MSNSLKPQVDPQGIDPLVVEAMCVEARQKCWDAVEAIASRIEPGMTEKEAITMANQYLASCGVRRFWHKTHIRFGVNTVLSFNDPYQNEVVLGPDDIFYIDIGPVWDSVESDCGKTFVAGRDPKKLKIAQDVEDLFTHVRKHWQATGASGPEMLDFAKAETQKMGYLLHPSYVKGHRLSEFSHSLYGKNTLFDFTETPIPERWVLEFQICEPEMKYGAFFEDILLN